MKNLILTLIICLFIGGLTSQAKVHLVQGLGENSEVWDELKASINSNCSGSIADSYTFSTQSGLIRGENAVNTNLSSTMKNLGIGHSMGGVILGRIQPNIDGFITVGSPNSGARIANNLNNLNVRKYISSGCKEVIEDIQNINLNPSGILSRIIEIIFDIGDGFDIFFCDSGTEFIESNFSSPNRPTVTELEEGALTPITANIPAVSIWTSIDNPIHWNFFDSSIDEKILSPFNHLLSNLAIAVPILETKLNVEEDITEALAFTSIFSIFFNPANITKTAYFFELNSQLEDATEWLEGSESAYATLIGANTIVNQIVAYEDIWICDCVDSNGTPIECPEDGSIIEPLEPIGLDILSTSCSPANCWENIPLYHYVMQMQESDGFIPRSSQLLNGSIDDIRIDNVSHVEQPKNNDVLNEIEQILEFSSNINLKIEGCVF